MIERFKNIFEGLDRAHGVTIVGESNGNGQKVKGKSFVKREPVTDELWQNHLNGVENLGIIPKLLAPSKCFCHNSSVTGSRFTNDLPLILLPSPFDSPTKVTPCARSNPSNIFLNLSIIQNKVGVSTLA